MAATYLNQLPALCTRGCRQISRLQVSDVIWRFIPKVQKHQLAKQMEALKSYHSSDPLVRYTAEHSLRQTDVQKRLDELTLKHAKGVMLGAPEVLQLNANIMRSINAKRSLDVGVFTGASSLSAAMALPHDGEVHALDISEEYTNIGKPFWEEAGVTNKIHLHVAPAGDTLDKFIKDGQAGTFDFAFIDADKPSYDRYYEQCLVLIRPGGVISFDNTLMWGTVADPNDEREAVVAIKKFNAKLKDDQRINISLLKVGDGLTLCFKK